MQTVIPSSGSALTAGVEAQAHHLLTQGLKVLSVAPASSAHNTPGPAMLHTFASIPFIPAKPGPVAPSSDQRLLTDSVESNLSSADIIAGTTLLRQLFQPKGAGSDSDATAHLAGRGETHIERVVREALEDPVDMIWHQTRMERVVQHGLTDSVDGCQKMAEPFTK